MVEGGSGRIVCISKDTPLGRIAQPADIAATAAFLVSESAGALVGQIVSSNGGSLT